MDIHQPVKFHLDKFYTQYNLGEEGGNFLPYVTIEFTSFFKVFIPNWDSRRKAVLRHDIHHVLTGYRSDIVGEFEIAAWEIASGCWNFFAAYLLNSGGLLAGIIIYPKPCFKAFVIGCRTTNLYQIKLSDIEMKNMSVAELKQKIGLSDNVGPEKPSFLEIRKLIIHILLSIILGIMIFVLSPLLILYNVWMYGKRLFGI